MKNINDIKIKLIRKICELENYDLLVSLLKSFDSTSQNIVAEPNIIYEPEKPMTAEEVDKYFEEEKVDLPAEILEILKLSEKQVENGQIYDNDDVKLYFEEWLKD